VVVAVHYFARHRGLRFSISEGRLNWSVR